MRHFQALFTLAILFQTTAAFADLNARCTIIPKSRMAPGPELTSLEITSNSLTVKAYLTKLNDQGTLYVRVQPIERKFQGPTAIQIIGDNKVLISLPHSQIGNDLPVNPNYRLLLVWDQGNNAFEGNYLMNRVSCTVEE